MNINQVLNKYNLLATTWGITDDFDRHNMIKLLSIKEIDEILVSIDEGEEQAILEWLCGEESMKIPLSEKYVTFSCFIEALDHIRIIKENS